MKRARDRYVLKTTASVSDPANSPAKSSVQLKDDQDDNFSVTLRSSGQNKRQTQFLAAQSGMRYAIKAVKETTPKRPFPEDSVPTSEGDLDTSPLSRRKIKFFKRRTPKLRFVKHKHWKTCFVSVKTLLLNKYLN